MICLIKERRRREKSEKTESRNAELSHGKYAREYVDWFIDYFDLPKNSHSTEMIINLFENYSSFRDLFFYFFLLT